jgi:glycosyltransferase involved in cell wall biosynthesis
MLRYAFKSLPVHRVHLSIDPSRFYPGDGPRDRRIAYMPRRGRADSEQVFHLLGGRCLLDGWEVVLLDGLTHDQVAEQLRTTRIFLAFTYQEGFGLPAAEAMACGNFVVGCHGFGGREFFHPEFSTPIETGDVLGFARAVEDAIVHERNDPMWCLNRGRKASEFVLSEYSPVRERDEVVSVYAELLKCSRST